MEIMWLSTVEDHPAFRNIKPGTHSATRTDFTNVVLSDNVRNTTSSIAHLMKMKSTYIDKCRSADARAWGKGREVIANGYGISFGGDKNILELDSDGGCRTL